MGATCSSPELTGGAGAAPESDRPPKARPPPPLPNPKASQAFLEEKMGQSTHSQQLFAAALRGDAQKVGRLCELGDPQARSPEGLQALHLAAALGHAKVCRLLCRARASLDDAGNSLARTPLALACAHGKEDCVKVLCEARCSVDRGGDGIAPLLVALVAPEALRSRIPAMLLELGADPNATCSLPGDGEGVGPLHLAAAAGLVDLCQALIAAAARPNARDRAGRTPLQLAAGQARVGVCRLLMAVRADPLAHGHDGKNGVLCACDAGDAACLATVIEPLHGEDLQIAFRAADGPGRSPLSAAAAGGSAQCVRLLLEKRVPPDGGGQAPLPLHSAAAAGAQDCVLELLKWRAGVNDRPAADPEGKEPHTALYEAIAHARPGACALLLDRGALEQPVREIGATCARLVEPPGVPSTQAYLRGGRDRGRGPRSPQQRLVGSRASPIGQYDAAGDQPGVHSSMLRPQTVGR